METVGELRKWIEDLPDDYEVWIEFPDRYGFHKPFKMERHIFEDQDFIKALSIGRDDKKRRLYIMHHF